MLKTVGRTAVFREKWVQDQALENASVSVSGRGGVGRGTGERAARKLRGDPARSQRRVLLSREGGDGVLEAPRTVWVQ